MIGKVTRNLFLPINIFAQRLKLIRLKVIIVGLDIIWQDLNVKGYVPAKLFI
jgi:hypothetical protein